MIRPDQRVVLALGGNALVRPGEAATFATQVGNVRRAMRAVVPLIRNGARLVVTHGNGLQVGHILIRVQEALGKAYALPLEACVAESQGELGYLIEQTLQNLLAGDESAPPVVSVLTQVIVDPKDPAFEHPTKPVGPYYTRAQARSLAKTGTPLVEERGRGFRMVVPSPDPVAIDDVDVLRWLMRRAVVIAAGGGGIPVVRRRGRLQGVPAVIDKDLASATLGRAIRAHHLVILTGEPCVYVHYRTPRQRRVPALTPQTARELADEGHFPPGSMGPKVEAAARFVENGGGAALITAPERLAQALRGKAGTLVTARRRTKP